MSAAGTGGYLRHVDGLRGVSVLLVVLYHAWPDTVPGGFIGVDVFFVISGFLITRLLLAERAAGTLSYPGFLMRRVRRLWPSFALVMAFTLLLGWILLDAEALADLGRTALAAIGLSSNWYFALTTGYFNEGLETNLLLHSWSLAVEEQFYLIYPLVLIWAAKFRTGVVSLLGVLWAASFVGVLVLGDKSEAFFATHLRVWELASGALLWCAFEHGLANRVSKLQGRWLGRLGLAVLVAMAFVMPRLIWWPSALSLVPVGAAVLCIAFPFRGLEARWLVGVGLISYALYLWHWPLLKGVEILWPGPPDGVLAIVILATIGLSWLAWRYVEEPVRRKQKLESPAALLAVAGGVSVMMAVLGWQYHAKDGFADRFPGDIAAIAAPGYDPRANALDCEEGLNALADLFERPAEPYSLGPPDERIIICASRTYAADASTVLYVGDSHLRAIRTELSLRAQEQGNRAIFATLPACPPVLGIVWDRKGVERAKRCQRLNKLVLEVIKTRQIDKTVLVAHWDIYGGKAQTKYPEFETHLSEFVEAVADKTDLHVMLDVPTHALDVPATLARAIRLPWLRAPKWSTRIEHETVRAPYLGLMQAAETRGQLTLHDPVPAMCPETVCLVQTEAGVLYMDGNHLSQAGGIFVLDALPDLP